MGTRTETHLVEIQESTFCPVILLEQGDDAVSGPYPGRQSHQPVPSSPCVRKVPLLDPGTPVGAPTIGRRLVGQRGRGEGACSSWGGYSALWWEAGSQAQGGPFCARHIFSAIAHLLSLISEEIFQQQGARGLFCRESEMGRLHI